MKYNIKTLYKYLTSLSITPKKLKDQYDQPLWLFQDDKHNYLVSFDPVKPNDIEFIHLGYVMTKKDLKCKDGYPESIVFRDGSGFIFHNLSGPASYIDGGCFVRYCIHGSELDIYTDEDLGLHPKVISHKKESLKNKISSLK